MPDIPTTPAEFKAWQQEQLALCDGATPGPWNILDEARGRSVVGWIYSGDNEIGAVECDGTPADAALIAAACNHYRDLLLLAGRLMEERDKLQEVLDIGPAGGGRVNMDNINHPPHYTQGTMEVIDAIEGLGLGFHAGNVLKYIARYKLKGGVEDLHKARWYLDRLIALEDTSG